MHRSKFGTDHDLDRSELAFCLVAVFMAGLLLDPYHAAAPPAPRNGP
jgi:hypothetical protein